MKLRTRVLLGFAIIFVVVIGAGAFAINAQRSQLYSQIDDRLLATPLPPEARARPVLSVGDASARSAEPAPDTESISDLFIAVFRPDGTLRPLTEGQLLDDRPDVGPLLEAGAADKEIITTGGINGTSTFRALFIPATETTLDTIVAVPIDDVDDTVRQLAYTFIAITAVVLVVLVLVASWLTRFGLRPIIAITEVSEAISEGERNRRVDIYNPTTEAGRLGTAFNVMLDERDAGEQRLREFVSNASHELRTPLTSIRGYLDLHEAGGFRRPGELDDAIRRLRVEAERMNILVEDLLVLAKFDEDQPLDITTFDVGAVVSDVAASALAGRPDRHIDVDVAGDCEVRADRFRLHQALAALVDNAIRHTPDDANVRIIVEDTVNAVEISVADTGPGLTQTEAARVFDRFTRGDQSRARRTGGSGLGLSISQTIIRAHGGDISLEAAPGDGATFTVALPAAPVR